MDILDMDVCWENNGIIERPARFVAAYNARDKHWVRMMTNLHRFVTRKRTIAEGLIWGSLAAAIFNGFLWVVSNQTAAQSNTPA
jgi:hypothetical protein